mmetsp:Transcript_23228/g.36329  ORF Transcript_23228/g.36329 Transcript_23228/m.36329 type:complete len:696 (+) Transcript_23228:72-2159(+)
MTHHQPRWIARNSYCIGSTLFEGLDKEAQLLDPQKYSSVTEAVSALNSRIVSCQRFCLVFSKSAGAYYFLWAAEQSEREVKEFINIVNSLAMRSFVEQTASKKYGLNRSSSLLSVSTTDTRNEASPKPAMGKAIVASPSASAVACDQQTAIARQVAGGKSVQNDALYTRMNSSSSLSSLRLSNTPTERTQARIVVPKPVETKALATPLAVNEQRTLSASRAKGGNRCSQLASPSPRSWSSRSPPRKPLSKDESRVVLLKSASACTIATPRALTETWTTTCNTFGYEAVEQNDLRSATSEKAEKVPTGLIINAVSQAAAQNGHSTEDFQVVETTWKPLHSDSMRLVKSDSVCTCRHAVGAVVDSCTCMIAKLVKSDSIHHLNEARDECLVTSASTSLTCDTQHHKKTLDESKPQRSLAMPVAQEVAADTHMIEELPLSSRTTMSIEDFRADASVFDPTDPQLKSQLLKKMGIAGNAAIEKLEDNAGSFNDGVWIVSDSKSDALVLKLVPHHRVREDMKTDTEKYTTLLQRCPNIVSELSFTVPVMVLQLIGVDGARSKDLLVMRKAMGLQITQHLYNKYLAICSGEDQRLAELSNMFWEFGRFMRTIHRVYSVGDTSMQHGDCQPSNVFYDEASGIFTLVDVADFGFGPFLAQGGEDDVEHFIDGLRSLQTWYGKNLIDACASEFRNGYAAGVDHQ